MHTLLLFEQAVRYILISYHLHILLFLIVSLKSLFEGQLVSFQVYQLTYR